MEAASTLDDQVAETKVVSENEVMGDSVGWHVRSFSLSRQPDAFASAFPRFFAQYQKCAQNIRRVKNKDF